MRVGVCSWSLRAETPESLAEHVQGCGLSAVQLAIDPILRGTNDLAATRRTLESHGISILSAMVQPEGEDYSTLDSIRETGGLRPDKHWTTNLAMAKNAASVCNELGCNLVTFHAGFIPHDPGDPEFGVMLDRVRTFSQVFIDRGIRVALETGQESAEALDRFMIDLKNDQIGINFDPANMILYDMDDPAEALDRLAHRVFQIHLKDATRTNTKGEWGTEVPVGTGEVDWAHIFNLIENSDLNVDLVFEREADDNRVGDIRSGLEFLRPHLTGVGAEI